MTAVAVDDSLDDLDPEAWPSPQPAGQVGGDLGFAGRAGHERRIDRVDADEILEQLSDE